MGYIYIILNIINGKFYLGSTKNLKIRKNKHFRDLRKGCHHSIYLQRAFKKHGEDTFIFVIIETSYNYQVREQELLDKIDFSDCYNVSKTATGGDLISNHPDRDRIIAENTQRLLNAPQPAPRYKEDNPNWRGGKTFCKCGARINSYAQSCHNCRDRCGDKNPFYGRKHSMEVKKKISLSRTGNYYGNQEKPVEIEGVLYKSLSEASKELGVNPSTLLYRIRSLSSQFTKYNYKSHPSIKAPMSV